MNNYFGESSSAFTPMHKYKCPRIGCRYETTAYTQAGMMRLADEHRAQHLREDRNREFIYRNAGTKSPEEYQVLKLTWADMCFLVTRGIKVDEDIELDRSNPKAVDGKDYPWLRSKT